MFGDDVNPYAVTQIKMVCDNKASRGSKIRVTADVHPSKVESIVFTMTVGKQALSSLASYNTGYGVLVTAVRQSASSFRRRISSSLKASRFFGPRKLPAIRCGEFFRAIVVHGRHPHKKGGTELGTLGDSNHFIEVDQDDDEELHIAVHSDSRHLKKRSIGTLYAT